jgi:hypothetical protein
VQAITGCLPSCALVRACVPWAGASCRNNPQLVLSQQAKCFPGRPHSSLRRNNYILAELGTGAEDLCMLCWQAHPARKRPRGESQTVDYTALRSFRSSVTAVWLCFSATHLGGTVLPPESGAERESCNACRREEMGCACSAQLNTGGPGRDHPLQVGRCTHGREMHGCRMHGREMLAWRGAA